MRINGYLYVIGIVICASLAIYEMNVIAQQANSDANQLAYIRTQLINDGFTIKDSVLLRHICDGCNYDITTTGCGGCTVSLKSYFANSIVQFEDAARLMNTTTIYDQGGIFYTVKLVYSCDESALGQLLTQCTPVGGTIVVFDPTHQDGLRVSSSSMVFCNHAEKGELDET